MYPEPKVVRMKWFSGLHSAFGGVRKGIDMDGGQQGWYIYMLTSVLARPVKLKVSTYMGTLHVYVWLPDISRIRTIYAS